MEKWKNKIWKKRLIVFLIVIGSFSGLLCSYKFGWRLFGYRFCDDPDTVALYAVIQDDCVDFMYGDKEFITSLDSYKPYHIEDGTLYIGVKTLYFVGAGNSFLFSIPTNERVEKVILTGRGKERQIFQDKNNEE